MLSPPVSVQSEQVAIYTVEADVAHKNQLNENFFSSLEYACVRGLLGMLVGGEAKSE